jgi:orotate phosphoribosyltransferase
MSVDVLQILKEVGAVLTNDHFVGTKGPHFATYVNKDALYPYTSKTSQVCALFADAFRSYQVDVVAGPALGGIILAQWTAAHLGMMDSRVVLGLYAEKKAGTLQLTRGYDQLLKGKRVAVVEDITTTGGSLKTLIAAIQAAGGEVVVAGVIVNKNPAAVTSDFFGVPFIALAELPIPLYSAEDCPLCQAGVPINTKIGHGKKFLNSKQAV